MTTGNLIWLILMGIVFLVWVVVTFRVLLGLKTISMKRRQEQNAGYFRWVAISFGVYKEFLTAEEHKSQRRQVLGLTVLLFAIIISRVMFLGA